MKKQIKTILAISGLLLLTNTSAITLDNGIKIDVNMDKNANLHPDLLVPCKYNDEYSSSIEYKTDKQIIKDEKVENADTSDKDTTIKHSLFRLNFLNYNIKKDKIKYYFGFGWQKETFYKTQSGFAKNDAVNVNFNNNIDMEVKSMYLKSDIIMYEDKFNHRFKINIVPKSDLKVSQTTTLSDTVNSVGNGNSDKSQDISYEISYENIGKFGSFADFGVEARYRFLPLKYNLKLANDDGTYSDEPYDVEEKTTYIEGKIYFNTKIINLMPTIGISKEKTKGKNKLDNKTYSNSQTKVLFGLNSRF